MADSFSRRDVLGASGLVTTAVLGGCLGSSPEIDPGHVYVENMSGGERELALVVAEQSDGALDLEVQAWYRIPEGYALQFRNMLEPDRTHVVRAELRNSPAEGPEAVTIDPCPEGRDAGERVVSVRLQPDEIGIIPFGCRDEYMRRELEYVEASEYLTGSLDESLTPTSEG